MNLVLKFLTYWIEKLNKFYMQLNKLIGIQNSIYPEKTKFNYTDVHTFC